MDQCILRRGELVQIKGVKFMVHGTARRRLRAALQGGGGWSRDFGFGHTAVGVMGTALGRREEGLGLGRIALGVRGYGVGIRDQGILH